MCSLVMSLCLRDLHVTSLNNNYYNTLHRSRLTVVQLTQRLVFGWYNINLFSLFPCFLSFCSSERSIPTHILQIDTPVHFLLTEA